MATCPKCGTTLKDDYGMSQCPGCGTFSFIDMDGNAMISAPEAGGAAAPPNFADPIEGLLGTASLDINANPESDSFAPLAEDASLNSAENPSNDGSNEGSHDGSHDFASVEPFGVDAPSSPEMSTPAEFASAEFESFNMDPIIDVPVTDGEQESALPVAEPAPVQRSAPPAPAARPQAKPQAFGPANDPLNLNEFANSEVSSAKDGPLHFKVLISGIDAKEIRESIREVLEDRRFAWDSNEIFSKIKRGELTIDGLSPVKASILITRIKHLPVTIRWEQYAITQRSTQSDSDTESETGF